MFFTIITLQVIPILISDWLTVNFLTERKYDFGSYDFVSFYREIGQLYKVVLLNRGIDRSSQLKLELKMKFYRIHISLKRGAHQVRP